KIKVSQGKNLQEGLMIEIRDNGCGIEEQNINKIYEPFFTTKSAESGSGLGMFICYNLVEGLGGRIDVKSKPGIETTFRIILPEIKQ
ncbi:MAG: HAMP domain-containing histidine kinase, partial [Desulfobulbaceae bacterium]|nr:HAMP domain-containing histidine kinase [Desulfobulbaceae bacterium]